MASPAQTLPPAPAPAEEFDPLLFWMRYKNRILLLLAMLLVAGAISLLYWRLQEASRVNSAKALAAAQSAEDLKKVADDYPRQPAGGNALLLLAEKQRDEGKLDESSATLQRFIAQQPNHPLVSGAYTSLAANAETQGKADEALVQYKKVITSYPLSFSAPAAYLGEARILLAQGKAQEAKSAYEAVVTQFPESPFRERALSELQKIKQ